MPRMFPVAMLMAPVLALALAATPAGAPGAHRSVPKQVLPWIEDDFTRALAEGKARKLPIVVESWAPW